MSKLAEKMKSYNGTIVPREDFLENAHLLTRLNGRSLAQAFYDLAEEVGEVGTCLSGRKKVTEPVQSECVDVVNCALELFFLSGGTVEDFQKLIEEKQSKWRKNICF